MRLQIWACLICVISPYSNGAVQIRVGLELTDDFNYHYRHVLFSGTHMFHITVFLSATLGGKRVLCSEVTLPSLLPVLFFFQGIFYMHCRYRFGYRKEQHKHKNGWSLGGRTSFKEPFSRIPKVYARPFFYLSTTFWRHPDRLFKKLRSNTLCCFWSLRISWNHIPFQPNQLHTSKFVLGWNFRIRKKRSCIFENSSGLISNM